MTIPARWSRRARGRIANARALYVDFETTSATCAGGPRDARAQTHAASARARVAFTLKSMRLNQCAYTAALRPIWLGVG